MIPLSQHEPRGAAVMQILRERERQDELKAAGRFEFTCADADMGDMERFAVLGEEFGEVARAVLENTDLVHDGDAGRAALRAELAQVAAVALAWLEAE